MVLGLTLLDSDTSIPSDDRSGLSWANSTDIVVAINNASVERLYFFPWDGSNLSAANAEFGQSNDFGVAFSPDGTKVAVVRSSTSTVTVYHFAGGMLGSLIDTSSSAGSGGGVRGVSWVGDFIATAMGNSGNRLNVWPFDGSSFGTLIQPATPPTSSPGLARTQAVAIAPDGSAVAIAHNTAGTFLLVYPFDGSTLDTPVAPGVSSGIRGLGVAWSPGSDFVALAVDDSPFAVVYSWNGSVLGTAIAPTIVSAGTGRGNVVAFGKRGEALFVGGNNMDENEELYAYAFDGAALTGRVDPTGGGPTAFVVGLAVSSDNSALGIFDSNQDIFIYATGLDPAVTATQTQAFPVFVVG